MISLSLISCESTKEKVVPETVIRLKNTNNFDTLLAIRGEDETYFFNYNTKQYINYASNDELMTKDNGINVVDKLIIAILILLFIITIFI